MKPGTFARVAAAIGGIMLAGTWANPTDVSFAGERAAAERRVPHVDSKTWRKLEQVQELIKSEEYGR